MAADTTGGWLFLSPDQLPERWKQRARPAVFVPLLAQEVSELLGGRAHEPALRADEQLLATLFARGLSGAAIARRLGVSHRTVERRLSALRGRLGVQSSVDLGLTLAAQGFAVAERPTAVAGGDVSAASNLAVTEQPGRGVHR